MWGRKEKREKIDRYKREVIFGKNLKMRAKDGKIEEGHYLRERAAPGGRAVAWGVSAYVGLRDAAVAAVLGWESCACQAWGRLLHGLREVCGLGTEEVMAGKRARGACGEWQLDGAT